MATVHHVDRNTERHDRHVEKHVDNVANEVKDPLANSLIPELIEELKKDSKDDLLHKTGLFYNRGKMLGKGGFAKVFAGYSHSSQATYALKVVAKCSLAKPKSKQKFKTEINIHRSLNHENIVRFERYFEDHNFAYISMELCSNNSMSELMKKRRTLCEPEARFYLTQILNSLQYLHYNLVIHRDLKLGNLFLDSDLRIKVGDFGLAAKLNERDERRKTICGTPNYIAPEILEGKCGHSFPVDIWSTGVILYTLLVGKPPFESKDVKSTYKRIMNNEYSFPDHVSVSTDAKDLISSMLQTNPDNRPSLRRINLHPFFGKHTPKTLPVTALTERPNFLSISDDLQFNDVQVSRDTQPPTLSQQQSQPLQPQPLQSMARLALGAKMKTSVPVPAPVLSKPQAVKASSQPVGNENDPNLINRMGLGHNAQQQHVKSEPRGLDPSQQYYKQQEQLYQKVAPLKAAPIKIAVDEPRQPMRSVSATAVRKNVLSGLSERVMPPVVSENIRAPLLDNYLKKAAPLPFSVADVLPLPEPQAAAIRRDTRDVVDRKQLMRDPRDTHSGPKKKPMTSAEMFGEVGSVSVKPQSERTFALPTYSTSIPVRTNTITAPSSSMPPKIDVFEVPELVAEIMAVSPQDHKHSSPHHEPMAVCTPPDQIIPKSNVYNKQPLGTLETMHEMLNNSFSFIEKASSHQATEHHSAADTRSCTNPTAKVWVTRYVDYTSKYGLGFLFNDGSAGVYFNDSTKIVLSADGLVFQYIERQKNMEHYSQTHLISNYPMELKKKVTLLKHFRNYMLDQEKMCAADPRGMEESLNGGNPGLIKDGVISEGASSSVRFGESSVDLHPRGSSRSSGKRGGESEFGDLPYLKKWVRTKHAILFRMSNRTVQVVFYDRSEVLLSSEARVITYVNKQLVRTEHSLDDILTSSRLDIAKRLKYTKDIMYRLIHTQTK